MTPDPLPPPRSALGLAAREAREAAMEAAEVKREEERQAEAARQKEAVATAQAARARDNVAEMEAREQELQAIRARAREILEKGDPVTFILDAFNRIHVGDRDLASLLLASLGAQLCRNTEGIHVGLFGDSGTGKSDAGKAMYHLLSSEFKRTGSMSDKALFYHPLPEKCLYFVDEFTVLTDEQEAIIREAISNFQTGSRRLTVKDQKPFDLEIRPRLAFWFTKQDTTLTRQMANRLITLNPDSSVLHQDHVHEASMKRRVEGTVRFDESAEVMVCREMDRILKASDLVTVAIPYLSRVEWMVSRSDYRAWEQFQDLICSFAAIHQYQRTRDPHGNVIATRADYDRANAIMTRVKNTILLRTDERGRAILQAIAEHGEVDPLHGEHYLELIDIAQILNWNRGKVHRLVYGGGDDENADRGLCSLSFFRVEKGMKQIGEGSGKKSVHYSTAYLKDDWDRLSGYNSIAYLPPDERG